MTFLADESVDGQVVDRLRADGHTVRSVAEMAAGISDEAVLSISNNDASILLTADKDFGDLVFRQGLVHQGVVLIRLSGERPVERAALLSSTISNYGRELTGNFSVLTKRSLRIRRNS
jgi:predicted nuclease of predicted toxin-antitoxin system